MAKIINWYKYWSKKKESKNDFEKDFCKLMTNAVFGKSVENVRKRRDIKLATIEGRSNYLASEPKLIILQSFSQKIY